MISRTIHYCWFGGKRKPALVEKCMESWRRLLPEWKFKEWSEENSPINAPYVEKALKERRFAFASDYVRFHALHSEGGVYLDTDMEIVRNLDPLLSSEFFVGRESERYINAGIVGSVRGYPLLKTIMDDLDGRAGKGFTAIPEIITDLIAADAEANRKVQIYAPEYFYPYNPFDAARNEVGQLFYSDVTANTFAVHHWAQSWSYTFGERMVRRMKMVFGLK
ncbi:MAG TPA: glycosyltransferase [Aromatoleum sp.]|uniref:glycosyltransferase family 32 protein n=1 Tax=Aromatoleum sp. TaxID=2307007 RepID=UPI002B4AA47D|nr:glycosyltransferase [Aromatoleum sp.]HJV25100.1 glycosyltransferase [Aromatoleum sp.]